MERIGLVGLGRMGTAIAGRLLAAGWPLTIWNRTADRAADLVAQGASLAATPADLAQASDVVLTILTDDAAIEDVYRGPRGLLAGAVAGKLFAEMSTVRTSTILRLGDTITEQGGALVDAPLSGSVGPARQGQLLALVGGAPADVERATPIFNAFCRRVAHLGPAGSGTTMKLVLNLPMAIYWQGLAEALALGSQFGLELGAMLELILDSQVAICALRAKAPAILGERGEVAFDITGVRKDLLAMIETGQSLGVPMPAASAALGSFMAATAAGIGHDDLADLIPHYIAAVRRTTEGQ